MLLIIRLRNLFPNSIDTMNKGVQNTKIMRDFNIYLLKNEIKTKTSGDL